MENRPIIFDDWEQVLWAEVASDRQKPYREAVVKFRFWLREKGKEAVDASFKEHLDWKKSYLPPERYEIRLEALR